MEESMQQRATAYIIRGHPAAIGHATASMPARVSSQTQAAGHSVITPSGPAGSRTVHISPPSSPPASTPGALFAPILTEAGTPHS